MSNTCSIDIEGCDCIDPVKILNEKKATAAKRHICNDGDIPSACIVPLTEKAKDLVCSLIDEEFKKKQTKERIK